MSFRHSRILSCHPTTAQHLTTHPPEQVQKEGVKGVLGLGARPSSPRQLRQQQFLSFPSFSGLILAPQQFCSFFGRLAGCCPLNWHVFSILYIFRTVRRNATPSNLPPASPPRSDYLAMGNGAKDMNIIKCYNYIFASLIKQCLLDSKCPLRCLYRGDQEQNKAIN